MNILAVGAHPDDIEFGCAHALIQEIGKGNRVKLLVLSRGEAGSSGTSESREAEAHAAAKLMGAEIVFIDLGGDCRIEHIPSNAFKIAVEIRSFQPAIVLAPHTEENQHPDHSIAGKLTRDACRFARYAGLDALKGFSEESAAHAIAALYYYNITVEFGRPDIVIDISAVKEKWEAAMACHASQMRTRSYSELRLSAARHLGQSMGVEYAAGFYVNDSVRVEHLSALTLSSRHF